LKAVRFLQKQMSYNAGEIAGFADSAAEAYVKAGIAEWHKPPKDVPEKPSQEIFDAGAAAQTPAEETIEETEGTKPAASQAGSRNGPATEEGNGTETAQGVSAPKPTFRRGR
jgi:hypothetical protein